MLSASVLELCEAVDRLEISVDGDELAEVFRLREKLLAKAMAPLRDFDAAQLYQLSKASSTKQFLERTVGLSATDAGSTVSLARKLGVMPLTEAAWLDGSLGSGQIRAITANVHKRLVDQFQAVEGELLEFIVPLTPAEAALAMQSWALHADAVADGDDEKPPREDEFFHSKTGGGRYVANGSFGPLTGAWVAKAIELAEADSSRDHDTRSPAERRAEALADVCSFYVDYRAHTDTDPDTVSVATVPRKRNWPQLIGVTTTEELRAHRGAQLLGELRIDATATEALSCTAQLRRLVLDEDGAIRSYQLLPAGVTDALFGALAARDQGCRWPGCRKNPIHCDVHHLHHQEHGGKTSPCNCCLFCKYHHHRAAHDTKIHLKMTPDGTLTITYSDGTTQTTVPPIHQPPLPHAA